MAAKKEKLVYRKNLRNQLIVLGRIDKISTVDAIFLVLFSDDSYCNYLESLEPYCFKQVFFGFFCKIYHCKKTKLAPTSNLKFLRHVFSIFCL